MKSGLGTPGAGLAQSSPLRMFDLAEDSAHQSKYSTKVELLAIGFWMGVHSDFWANAPPDGVGSLAAITGDGQASTSR